MELAGVFAIDFISPTRCCHKFLMSKSMLIHNGVKYLLFALVLSRKVGLKTNQAGAPSM